MRRTLCVALAGLAIILGACGSDDDDSSDEASDAGSSTDAGKDEYVEAAVSAIGADMEEADLAEDVVNCIAAATVDAIGVDTFQDAGITPAEFADSDDIGELDLDLPDSAVDDMTAALEGCELSIAFATLMVSGFEGVTGETPEGAEACLAENLDDAELAAVAAKETLLPSDQEESSDLNTQLGTALGACPDALSELLVGSFEAGLGAELSAESRDCVVSFVDENAEAVAEGFMSSGGDAEAESEDGSDILGTDLLAACPTLAAQIEAVQQPSG